MHEKFDTYDLFGVLIPGVLVVCALPLAFPNLSEEVAKAKLPDTFAVIGLTAASVFAGYLVQALASLFEPLLTWTWGGRFSERALSTGLGDRYLSKDDGNRIRSRLLTLATPAASDQSLFLIAMQHAEATGAGRAPRFNALYAFHRALLLFTVVAIGLFAFSFRDGLAARLTWQQNLSIAVALTILLILFWFRARQRALYYVREVLLSAERQFTRSGS